MHPQSPTNFTKYALNLLRNDSPITQNINRLTPKLQLYRSYGEPQSAELYQEPIKFISTAQVIPFQIQKNIKKKKIITNNLVQKVIKLTCKCLKSKCLKQYCECYASGRHCSEDCNCQDCSNQKGTPTPLHQNKQTYGCNCKKTACAKRYCECYLKGQRCTFLCNCIDCCNQDDDSDDSQSSKENIDTKNYGELGSNLLQNAELFQKIGL